MDEQRLEACVKGRVQGVGFRAYTQDVAQRLGVAGGVCNGADGAVYVIAEGTRQQLDKLVEQLWQGPGRVDSVAVDWRATSGLNKPFEVWR